MKDFWVKWSVLLLLVGMVSCRPDEIQLQPGGEEKTPEQGRQEVPLLEKLAHIEVVTDGGKAVDSKENKDYRPCSVTVDWLFDNARILDARAQIRGRGNSTWNWYPKKPYRIKLDESAAMVGLPANKDWVLLADYRDVTHMMNATGFYLARELGLPCANHIRWVTLSLNGEDIGLYALTEQVEEGGNRVPLDANEGILLALDLNDGPSEGPKGATDNFWSEVFGMAGAVKYPKDATKAQRDKVKTAFAELEAAIDGKDWEEIQELLDVDSMIHYIMIQEIMGNVEMDNGNSIRSGYIHRHDNKSKWVMGPLWDCDGGFSYNWGDMYDSWGWGHTYFENYKYLVFGSDPYRHAGAYGATAPDFFCRLFGIPAFVERYQARWKETHTQLLEGLLDYLGEVDELIGDYAKEDMERWGIRNYNYDTQVRGLMTWLANRFNYLDGIVRNYPKK